jgi:hypothetical protein
MLIRSAEQTSPAEGPATGKVPVGVAQKVGNPVLARLISFPSSPSASAPEGAWQVHFMDLHSSTANEKIHV